MQTKFIFVTGGVMSGLGKGVTTSSIAKLLQLADQKVSCIKIDPYLNLKCFTEGVTEENMAQFFMEDGKLDLLIDECDGLEIKVLCRHMARALKIPVVMEASDRGMVDVERFDLEPERPLLHGMIGDLNPEKLKTLKSNEDKIPYMLAIVGLETISTRAKASMIEIGEETGQLAEVHRGTKKLILKCFLN